MQQLNFNFIISILLLLLLPSFLYVILDIPSLSLGILIVSSMLIITNYQYLKKFTTDSLNASFIVLVLLIFFIQSSYFYIVLSQPKPFYSLVFLLVIFAAFLLAQKISKLTYQQLLESLYVIILILIFLGWLKFYYTPFTAYTMLGKPVFPFSEESHFALALGMLTVSYASVGTFNRIIFITVNSFLLALFFPNLTLLVFSILTVFASLLRLKPIYFKLILFFLPICTTLLLFVLLSSSEYFSSRLTFNDSTNLTTLVYLQGWDIAYLNLLTTKGLGVGFQMLGMADTISSHFTEMISTIGAEPHNLTDGGFLASKIISEFGIIGIFIIIFYIYYLVRFIFYSNRVWNKIRLNNNINYIQGLKKELLLRGILFGFLVEVFLRGYGYFSPGVFLALVVVFYLFSNSDIERRNITVNYNIKINNEKRRTVK